MLTAPTLPRLVNGDTNNNTNNNSNSIYHNNTTASKRHKSDPSSSSSTTYNINTNANVHDNNTYLNDITHTTQSYYNNNNTNSNNNNIYSSDATSSYFHTHQYDTTSSGHNYDPSWMDASDAWLRDALTSTDGGDWELLLADLQVT